MLSVKYLGTSGTIPTANRNLPGILVNREGVDFLLDVGEGTQRQMVRYDSAQVEYLLLTSDNTDHLSGLPGIVQYYDYHKRENSLTIIGPVGSENTIESLVYAGRNEPSYEIDVVECGPDETIVDENEFRVSSFNTQHNKGSIGYILSEYDRRGRFDRSKAIDLNVPEGPKFGRLSNGESVEAEDGTTVEPNQVLASPRPGRKVVYTGDTRPTEDTIEAARHADVLIHDSTFGSEHKSRARSSNHSTAKEAAAVASQADVKELHLTHLSPRYEGNYQALSDEAKETFENSVIPDDGQRMEVEYVDERSWVPDDQRGMSNETVRESQDTTKRTEYSSGKIQIRDSNFRDSVKTIYDHSCAICEARRFTPDGNPEVEAAHIRPWSENGSNEVNNGISLCKLHHWAFDNGWISIDDSYEVLVKDAKDVDGYSDFEQYEGERITLPDSGQSYPNKGNLQKHREQHGFE